MEEQVFDQTTQGQVN